MLCSANFNACHLHFTDRVTGGAMCGRKQSVFLLAYGQGQRNAAVKTMDTLLSTG